jgi:alpha-galactosidase
MAFVEGACYNFAIMDEIVIARKLTRPLDSQGLPDPRAWMIPSSVSFCSDWRGENPDPERETCARLLWSPDHLFIRFECRYRGLFVYEGGNSRRDKLWLRDVAEVFLRPVVSESVHYREFEISPNGDWLDLDISPGEKRILLCDLKCRVMVDPRSRIWTAEMAIPMDCLISSFDPRTFWRLNLFRIEGDDPKRFYSAWRPTFTPQPNFHVPDAFGILQFQD